MALKQKTPEYLEDLISVLKGSGIGANLAGLIETEGDLLVGKSAGRAGRRSPGANLTVLTRDDSDPLGVVWAPLGPGGATMAHGDLTGLGSDDHPWAVHISASRTITAQHTFSLGSGDPGPPFILSADRQGQLVTGLKADQLNKSIAAGAGLTGGGLLTVDRTIDLRTPGSLSVGSINSATGNHTHAVTSSSNPGAAASLLATDASGHLRVVRLGIGITPENPLHVRGAGPVIRANRNSGTEEIATFGNEAADAGGWARYISLVKGVTGSVDADAKRFARMGVLGSGDSFTRFWISVDPDSAGPWADNHFSIDANANVEIGISSSGAARLQVRDAVKPQLRLTHTASTHFANLTVGGGGNLTIRPTGDLVLDPDGVDVLPESGYELNLGSLQKKYLTLHAAELWVETLVAQDTVATIGGRVVIAPTTILTEDLPAVDTLLVAKHNQLSVGDVIWMESGGKLEFMSVVSGPTGPGPYNYTVTRNLDGTGANDWYAGDALVNTGQGGDGFIDLYSISGINAGSTSGPTIAGNVRKATTYNDWVTSWAVGNLNGLYDYGSSIYGAAFGQVGGPWVSMDNTNGVRVMHASTKRFDVSTAGVLTIRDSDGLAVFTFNASQGAEFTKSLTLGASGGIFQGTGTFANPTTGLKIWNSGGVGRIAGFNGGVEQVGFDTDGKLKAGAGKVILSASGLEIESPDGVPAITADQLFFTSDSFSGDVIAGIGGYTLIDPAARKGIRIAIDTYDGTGTDPNIHLISDESAASSWMEIGACDNIVLTETALKLVVPTQIGGTGATPPTDGLHVSGGIRTPDGLAVGSFSATPVDDEIRLYRAGTLMGQFSTTDTTWLRINQDVAKNIFTPQGFRADGGFNSATGGVRVGDGNFAAAGVIYATDAITTPGTITGGALIIDNGAADGGDIILRSSGFTSWNMDNASGVVRLHRAGTVRMSITAGGAGLWNATLNVAGNLYLNSGTYHLRRNGSNIEWWNGSSYQQLN